MTFDDQTPEVVHDEEWAAEIQRRIDQIDRGEVTLIPWDAVMQELRERSNENQS